MPAQDKALRKRQQIAKANKLMFIWVAIASLVVGVSAVLSYFLVQNALFGERVLAEKSRTDSVLKGNNKVAESLREQVRVLNTNQALRDARMQAEQNPVEVVLDALPSEHNAVALGASLQDQLLQGEGITIETLTVESASGDDAGAVVDDGTEAVGNTGQIHFSFQVSAGSAEDLRTLLQRVERSIRTIQITQAQVEMQGNRLVLTASGVGYYQAAKSTDLTEKTVR